MSYLIDTNIISEVFKAKPNNNVVKWFQVTPSNSMFISVITLGEIRKGIEKMDLGKKRTELILWLDHKIPEWFENRILAITKEVADRWGFLCAHSKKTLPAIDGLLAATSLAHNLKFATRNVRDFKIDSLEVINPFEYYY